MGVEAIRRQQLDHPHTRMFDPAYHGEIQALGPRKTRINLSRDEAQQVLREAIHDPAEAAEGRIPSLWGIRNGEIYRFMFDNQRLWHGYQTAEKPPTSVLRTWLSQRKITNSEYTKILQMPHRGK
jgi:hypothetical protein